MTETSRRHFLKGAAGGAIATGTFATATLTAGSAALTARPAAAQTASRAPMTGTELLAPPTIGAEPGSDAFWDEVRAAFNLDNYIHMNTGTTGSMPAFVQNNLAVYNHYKSSDPLNWRDNLEADYPDIFAGGGDDDPIDARQARIAEMYGADPEEIMLSYNTSDGCNIVIGGTPWQPGDRIVTTNLEHSGMLNPIRWARDTHDVEVEVVTIPKTVDASMTVDDILALFEPALSRPLGEGNKQYLAFSEIPYKNGLRLPVKALTELARANGAYVIVDSAHGWGMLPVNCHDYGADFIAGAGHKWLCGGPGTGILYVRNSGENLPPFYSGNLRQYRESQLGNRDWNPSFMQARGEYNRPALYAMVDSADFFDRIGLERIYEKGVMLGNHLKDRVADKWGEAALWVQKNPEPEFATFLTAFNPLAAKDDPSQFSEMETAMNGIRDELSAMSDPKIYIRTISWHSEPSIARDIPDSVVGFRVSTHPLYNSISDVDTMFDALVERLDASGLEQLKA
ncbi:aminotransferase class V-fold PLP-dependent enzyme [Palleronia sp. LCG004]|uniref:aminotransferase class V-fold PLP-dependent enzyme n=1 Tax=Palleronia sp. LCG004 TaxID=3079304 RepID=UPI00294242D3|nr:aminotransferase class V-fold PLP-dependent enzyme [Palleronia sp. LCG004]WOI58012.1 aminotransferase class V-fold PLP-dependent enzyme [Palleronia sp. LCG004]